MTVTQLSQANNQEKDKSVITITPQQIEKYDIAGPRYTSYPTADRFVEAFDENAYIQALEQRAITAKAQPLSLYVHVPFCESLCFYCACNKIVTKRHEKAAEYLHYLGREIEMHTKVIGTDRPVSQLHLGGGTPTFFSDDELSVLMDMIQHAFKLEENGEYSIEIDPRTIDAQRLKHLASLGFNRLSFGVQDFDRDVQEAVHRVQPVDQVFELTQQARDLQFESVNIDLIYGLPKQTPTSFATTLKQVVALKPERIALYAYAHLPQRFKPQRRISQYELPDASAKINMLSNAISSFINAGYVYIGMDHFALPTDSLAIAKKQGRLHRNFQGYSTQAEMDLIGLGVSSIGKIGANYSQNAKTLEEYYDHIDQGRFPVVRGLAVSRDDLIRRAVIMAIMCHGELRYESIELSYMINFRDYFAQELELLKEKETIGLLTIESDGFNVTETGWFFIRAVAMVFDKYLQTDANRARFSKII